MRRDESGAIAIVVALMAVVLFGFAALVVDIGNALDVREQASAAADAGVLAGERYLTGPGAVAPDGSVSDPTTLATTVQDEVDANYPAARNGWATCVDNDVPAGFTPVLTSPCVEYQVVMTPSGAPVGTSVRVRIPPRKLPATFGGIFGVGSISVSPVAAARAGEDPPSPCQPCDPRLDYTSGQPVPPAASLPDTVQQLLPVATAIDPPVTPVDANGCPTSPGRYDADVDVTGNASCPLPSGLYVFNNSALKVAATVPALTGTGVTLLFYGTDPNPLTLATPSVTLAAVPPGLGLGACGNAIPGVAIVINENGAGVATSSAPASPSPSGVVSTTPTTSPTTSVTPTVTPTDTATDTATATPTSTPTSTPTAPTSAPVSSPAPDSATANPGLARAATSTAPTASTARALAASTPATACGHVTTDQATTKRSFDLGPSFDITGSVYALDGNTTWVTASGECTTALDCRIRDTSHPERIAVTATNFAGGVTPTVRADHDPLLAPPQPEHLSE